jgi:hypothetical protein
MTDLAVSLPTVEKIKTLEYTTVTELGICKNIMNVTLRCRLLRKRQIINL